MNFMNFQLDAYSSAGDRVLIEPLHEERKRVASYCPETVDKERSEKGRIAVGAGRIDAMAESADER